MIFASFIFPFWFLSLFLAAYVGSPRKTRNLLLTVFSYGFYAWWRPDFVWLMLVSTVVDYLCSRKMGPLSEARRHRGLWLTISLITNLGLLAYFKYANLAVNTTSDLSIWLGGEPLIVTDVILPIGISFYTFQSMSYSIDVYYGEFEPERNLLDLACYVSMFPQLVAGPIVRYRWIKEQLHERGTTLQSFSDGALLFMLGFGKKVLIADNAAVLADQVFGVESPGMVAAWLGVLGYAVQIYFDFSGYSDMAVGLGRMIGFSFPKNFDGPYRSASITEFWRRWHISLSSWLRDYLYVPLGGNRKGKRRTYVNLALTMLLGGLWHGAAWTFVIWGAYQGLFLVIERLFGKKPLYAGLPKGLRVLVTFVLVLGGWAVFRAENMTQLGSIYGGMVGASGIGGLPVLDMHGVHAWTAVVLGMSIAWFVPQAWDLVERGRTWLFLWAPVVFLLALGQLFSREGSPFIYFQF